MDDLKLSDGFSTVDLLELTSLDQFSLYWKYYLPFLLNKLPYELVNYTEPSPLASIPWSIARVMDI